MCWCGWVTSWVYVCGREDVFVWVGDFVGVCICVGGRMCWCGCVGSVYMVSHGRKFVSCHNYTGYYTIICRAQWLRG